MFWNFVGRFVINLNVGLMVRYMEIKMIEITDKFVYEFLEIYSSK